MKIKKYVLLMLCIALLSVSVVGCTGATEEVTEVDNNKIVIWTWDDTFNVKAARMAAVEYQKARPDVQIIVEPKEREEILADTKNILSARVYSKLPDIIMIEDYDVQEVLSVYENEFVDLTDQVCYDKFADYKNQLCSKDERMYGIPFDSGTAALFYRIDILNQAGYSEEDMQNLTWERYIEIGRDVYRKTGIPMLTLDPTDFPLIRIIMQSCGQWYVDKENGQVEIQNNEALKQALEVYRELLETDVGVSVNGWNEFISSFQNGEVATVISGSWIISSIKASKEQAGLWRVAPIPIMKQNANAVGASNVGGSSWYVLKNSSCSQEATQFLVSMFSENDDFIDSLISEIGIIPAVKNPTVFQNYEAKEAFFGEQQVTKLLTGLADEIPAVNYGSNTYEIEDILEDEFQHVLVDSDVEECLKRVQMKAEAVVSEKSTRKLKKSKL